MCDMPLRDDRSIRSPDMQQQKKHTHLPQVLLFYMVAYYATTPMTTFDVLFVCGTLILRIAGAFLIACLTSHILTAGAIVFLRITRGWSQEL